MSDVPKVLGVRGAALWLSIMADLEGDQHDQELVLETCKVVDTLDALAETVAAQGVTVAGSRGQIVVNPAVQEQRLQQIVLSRLIGQLNLDEAALGAVLSARQASAKRAGQQRWRALKGVRDGSS